MEAFTEMKTLLEKTRRINRLLQKTAATAVNFNDMAGVLAELLGASVYVASRKGKLLGYAFAAVGAGDNLTGAFLPDDFNIRMMKLDETTVNLPVTGDLELRNGDHHLTISERALSMVPVNGGGERLGTLFIGRADLTDEDLLLAEYGATVVGMEILRAHAGELEGEARKKAAVQIALGTLSYSELEAVQHIFDELEGSEGLLVASKIADRVGITRSVIVNALRKFESAGVIESRSLGMKGTHIKVLNDHLVEELRKLR